MTKKTSQGDNKELWSGSVTEKEKWHSPPGLFNEKPKEIARVLKENSSSERQAMSRLNFYVNRAGDNLSGDDRKRLDSAKEEIRRAYRRRDRRNLVDDDEDDE